MSRRMLMMALALATAAGATTNYAARLQNPFGEARPAVAQPPERPEPPEPPAPPRGEGREMPPMARLMQGGGIQMTASGKFVYILRGDEILQFEATSLEFIKKIKLPPPERPKRPDA